MIHNSSFIFLGNLGKVTLSSDGAIEVIPDEWCDTTAVSSLTGPLSGEQPLTAVKAILTPAEAVSQKPHTASKPIAAPQKPQTQAAVKPIAANEITAIEQQQMMDALKQSIVGTSKIKPVSPASVSSDDQQSSTESNSKMKKPSTSNAPDMLKVKAPANHKRVNTIQRP